MGAPTKRHLPLLLGHNKSKAVLRGKNKKVTLNLTSMIDMFTILVVFLLKSYSAEGQIVSLSDALTLPESWSDQKIELNLEIIVTNDAIIVDGEPIVFVDESILSEANPIPILVERLSDHLEYTRQMRGIIDESEMKVNIQGDVATRAILLQRVMSSCAQAGYATQNLTVIKVEGGDEQ
ncbi:MAG: biopolymer transporter ExbD [Candidatus Aegiribacteria sp.]|nr:biopolymer transporter ExbD [Candidatus Aegiribacteria sp.]